MLAVARTATAAASFKRSFTRTSYRGSERPYSDTRRGVTPSGGANDCRSRRPDGSTLEHVGALRTRCCVFKLRSQAPRSRPAPNRSGAHLRMTRRGLSPGGLLKEAGHARGEPCALRDRHVRDRVLDVCGIG